MTLAQPETLLAGYKISEAEKLLLTHAGTDQTMMVKNTLHACMHRPNCCCDQKDVVSVECYANVS